MCFNLFLWDIGMLPLAPGASLLSASHLLRTTHLGPGSHSPLGWAGNAEAGPPGLRPGTRTGLGWHGLTGAVGEGQQALYPPSLHPQLPAAPAAGTPFFRHPSGNSQDIRRGDGPSRHYLPHVTSHPQMDNR